MVEGEKSQALALWSFMSRLIWLLLMALCGWFAGKSVGGMGMGTVADLLLGITGALTVRFFLDTVRVTVQDADAFLLSACGAATLPCFVRFLAKRHDRRASPRKSRTP